MLINIDYKSREPIYEQIVNNIEKYVTLGILKPNEHLPSIRDLAYDLGINPNTVKKAYDILENKGVILSISTKGTFISENIESLKKEKIDAEFGKINEIITNLIKLGLTKEEILSKIKDI